MVEVEVLEVRSVWFTINFTPPYLFYLILYCQNAKNTLKFKGKCNLFPQTLLKINLFKLLILCIILSLFDFFV